MDSVWLNPDIYKYGFVNFLFFLHKFIYLKWDNGGGGEQGLIKLFSVLAFSLSYTLDFLIFLQHTSHHFGVLILNRESLLHYKDHWHHLFYTKEMMSYFSICVYLCFVVFLDHSSHKYLLHVIFLATCKKVFFIKEC